jgi:hypothetical protein
VSLAPGTRWSPAILEDLRNSNWVFFLASRAACNSPNVQQEMGAAVITRKKLIPIVWDMSPSDLPGWTKEFQALNLSGASADQVRDRLSALAGTIKNQRSSAGVLAALLFAGLMIYAATRE